jgi:hypothetical protein
MKTLIRILAIPVMMMLLLACSSNVLTLFDVIRVQLPSDLVRDGAREYYFVNAENGVTVNFSMTQEKSFGALLPRVDFDFLYNRAHDSTVIIKNKEIKEISGLKVGIVEEIINQAEGKTFFTEINNEILMCKVAGDTANHKYMCALFDGILNSIQVTSDR